MSEPILEVDALTVSYGGPPVLRKATITVRRGETVAIVGPSGSGKTTLLRAVLGMLNTEQHTRNARVRIEGSIRLNDTELTTATEREYRRLRGTVLGYVGQDPFGAMDPIMSVATNIEQAWRVKRRPVPNGRITADLTAFGVPDGAARARGRPFTWSGGMLQRASIIGARALTPQLILADEPTHALDDVNSHRVLSALTEEDNTLLMVSHNRELVRRYADRCYVVEAGRLVEVDPSLLLESAESQPRRALRATSSTPLIEANALAKRYRTGGGLAPTDLAVRPGEILGVTGPSGVGKSTLLRLLAGMEQPSAGGELRWAGAVGPPPHGQVGLVFQNALGSLAPHRPIYRSITEPRTPRLRDRLSRTEAMTMARNALQRVGLGDIDPNVRPRQLSGGQAQRVAIARALVGDVRALLADEPTAALDSANATMILALLRELADNGMAIVLVSHATRALTHIVDNVVELTAAE